MMADIEQNTHRQRTDIMLVTKNDELCTNLNYASILCKINICFTKCTFSPDISKVELHCVHGTLGEAFPRDALILNTHETCCLSET